MKNNSENMIKMKKKKKKTAKTWKKWRKMKNQKYEEISIKMKKLRDEKKECENLKISKNFASTRKILDDFKVQRCCCNFFRENRWRFPYLFFGICVFLL